MIFLDANIIIFALGAHQTTLVNLLDNTGDELACSEMVYLEVLGYPRITAKHNQVARQFFSQIRVIAIDSSVIEKAIRLRQQKTIKSPDAIIAATALIHKQILWTANAKDFQWIEELKWHNPLVNDAC